MEQPRKAARPPLPKLKSPETPKLVDPPLFEREKPKPEIPSAALRVPDPPKVAVPVARPSPPPKAPEPIPVRTGLFGGAPEPVTTRRPLQQVQTGGFGSPEGLPGRAQGGNPGNVPRLGSFGLPTGPGVGNGTGITHGVQGVVASAGFGSSVGGMGDGQRGESPGSSPVTMGGFRTGVGDGRGAAGSPVASVSLGGFHEAAQAAPSAPKIAAPPPVDFQPVEIISKPSPIYTEEARRLGIQGEVALSVVFLASGTLKITGVVKSLGHGLDEAAVEAATQIRFKPAQRDGKPADFPATLRIEFRLAEQSTS